jgi:hypothetical protein
MMACPEDYSPNWINDTQLLNYHSAISGIGIRGASQTCKDRFTNGRPTHGGWRHVRPEWWMGDLAYRIRGLNINQIFVSLRDPVDRYLSYLCYFRRTWCEPNTSVPLEELAGNLIANDDFFTQSYLRSAMLLGHQSLATIGKAWGNSSSNKGVLLELQKQLCETARNVAWVGFQDSFEESICLLHKRFGPFPLHPLELVNMREGACNNTEITDRIGVAVRGSSKN